MKPNSELVNRLLKNYGEKLANFRESHVTHITCFPDGIRYTRKKEGMIYKCRSFRRDIYVCSVACESGSCEFFIDKTYLCEELGCRDYPECISFLPEKKVIKRCKKKGLYKKRLKLERLYEKFFLMNKIFRGLKIDPDRTIRWLRKRKEKKDKKNGKIQLKKVKTGKKKAGKVRKIKNKKSSKKKASD